MKRVIATSSIALLFIFSACSISNPLRNSWKNNQPVFSEPVPKGQYDFDGDGRFDLLSYSSSERTVAIVSLQQADGTFKESQRIVRKNLSNKILLPISVPGIDGLIHLYEPFRATTPTTIVYRNNGKGVFLEGTEVDITLGLRHCQLPHAFDDDSCQNSTFTDGVSEDEYYFNDRDFHFFSISKKSSPETQTVGLYTLPRTLDKAEISTTRQWVRFVAAEDIDRDGYTDLIIQNEAEEIEGTDGVHRTHSRIYIYYGEGNGKFEEPSHAAVNLGELSHAQLCLVDQNKDGFYDLSYIGMLKGTDGAFGREVQRVLINQLKGQRRGSLVTRYVH